MAPKQSFPPVILPARMSLRPEAFKELEMAVLELPYRDAIHQFVDRLKEVLGRRMHWRHHPPYRVLSNTITACTPTVVRGFEKYYCRQTRRNQYRMLAVGKQNGSPRLQCPDEEFIVDIVKDWIQHWGESAAISRYVKGELASDWAALEQATEEPSTTRWTKIRPTDFLNDVLEDAYTKNGLAFSAVPALLSTFLHEQTSTIRDSATEIRWRRSQDEHGSLCVVSQPIHIEFTKQAGQFRNETVDKEGFFTYKLVFKVQLQTGRKAPWIYVFLHCQRYVDKPLKYNKRGHDITILTGMYQPRMSGLDADTTLVRLKASSFPTESARWLEYLPSVLQTANARSLANPYDIYQNPRSFWQSEIDLSQRTQDEYYIPYIEGYQYDDRTKNPVATGFGLAERSDVIEKTCCELLQNYLQPDSYLEPDQIVLPRRPFPLALQSYQDLSKKPTSLSESVAKQKGLASDEESRQEYNRKAVEDKRAKNQPIVREAIAKSLQGKQLNILIAYRDKDTKIALLKQIRETFLLNDSDELPEYIVITECPVVRADLYEWLDVGDLDPRVRHRSLQYQPSEFISDWEDRIYNSHCERRHQWIDFLRERKSALGSENTCYVAFIELPSLPSDTMDVHKEQDIKGAIREACAKEKILSQMIQPITLKAVEKESAEVQAVALEKAAKDKPQEFRNRKDKGRTLNAVQDLMIRQLGVLYGSPTELYRKIGFKDEIAEALDIIAFCITETSKDVLYCCAIRLRADRSVDVRFPEDDNRPADCQWIPYHQAGWKLGQIFGIACQEKHDSDTYCNPIKLSRTALNTFVENTLTRCLERPTIAIIKAKKWRDGKTWGQLRVGPLATRLDVLEFEKGNKQKHVYKRKGEDNRLHHLLCVVRIRTDDETPQYITSRNSWQDDSHSKDLAALSGFIDITEDGVFHYFSVGRVPSTVGKPQSTQKAEDPYKIEKGGGISFKHQQMVEMVPFFVRSDFRTEEGKKLLCRVPHYLRSTPAWAMGNTVLSYPMHLGDALLRDHFCILR